MIRGPVAGVLASISFGWTAVACGSALAVFFPVALFVLIERRRRIPANLVLGEAGERLSATTSICKPGRCGSSLW